MNLHKNRHNEGGSIVEIVVAVAMFILIGSGIMMVTMGSYTGALRSEDKVQAIAIAQEGMEAVRSIRDYSWGEVVAGTHGLTDTNDYWELSGNSDTIGKFEREIEITDISSSKKEVAVTVTWDLTESIENTFTVTGRLTNWKVVAWIQTLLSEFQNGYLNSVELTETDDGEVQLVEQGDFSSATVLDSINLEGSSNINDMLIQNNYLYLAMQGAVDINEFTVYDISDVSHGNISELGSVDLEDDANELIVNDGYAFIATDKNDAEVQIVRLSDFTNVNSIDLPSNSNVLSIDLVGDLLYVGTSNGSSDEFYAYDVSSPEAFIDGASPEGSVEIGDIVNDIAISGDYAYLATESNSEELVVVKLSSYTVVNTVNISGNADMTTVQIVGDVAYMGREGSSDDEFFSLDISSPEGSITVDDEIDISTDNVNDFYINGETVFAATDYQGDQELAIFDLTGFTVEGRIDIEGSSTVNAIEFLGAYIYAGTTDNTYTLQVIRGGQAGGGGGSSLEEKDTYNTTSSYNAQDVYVDGNYAYMVTSAASGSDPEFYIFDISDPTDVSLEGSYNVGNTARSVMVSGNYAYLATDDNSKELMVLDISNKSSPSEAGSYNSDEGKNGLAVFVVGDTAYLGTANNSGGGDCEFYVLDVSNKGSISLEDELEISDEVWDIYVSGNYAYLATNESNEGFISVDVSNPNNVSIEDIYNFQGTDNAYGVYVDGNRAYVTTIDNGSNHDFYIFNISNPGNISKISGLSLGTNREVFVNGDYAYVASDQNNYEFMVIDISNENSPSVSANYDLNGDANGIFFSNNYIYLATEHNSNEFIVYGPQGGGGGGGGGGDYVTKGIFTSDEFDSGSTSTTYGKISWTQSGTGTVKFQIRTANSEANLDSAKWVGSDGTGETYYTVSDSDVVVDSGATGTRWIQFMAILEGDSTNTPILEDVTIEYAT